MISVAVIPLPRAYKPLKESDIESESIIKTQGGHGPGGQHQNARDSAVRVRHKPSGIEVFINGRNQHQNRRNALQILAAKVNALAEKKQRAVNQKKIQKQMSGGGRGDKIRTYNFIDCRIVDHRLGKKTKQIKEVMKGKFELIWD